MGKQVKVCGASDLAPGQCRMVEADGKPVALFNVDGRFYAIGGECTHMGGPLGEGQLTGATVECPWHGATFDVATGEATGLPATEGVPAYPVMVEEGEVRVELP